MVIFDYEPTPDEALLLAAIQRAKAAWRGAGAAPAVWDGFASTVRTARQNKHHSTIITDVNLFTARLEAQ